MKRIFQILVFLAAYNVLAQMEEATLFLIDGSELVGYAKITDFGTKVRFSKTKKGKRSSYYSKELKRININLRENVDLGNPKGDLRNATFYFKNVSNLDYPILLERILKGKITLYRKQNQGNSGSMFPQRNVYGSSSYPISKYYVSKNDSTTVLHLGTKGSIVSKNFKKSASNYFKDCPALVAKVQSKEYRKRDIVEVIEFYNKNCK